MRGGALLLAAVAIVVLLLARDRAPRTDRAPSDREIETPALDAPPPPEPPDVARPGARLVGRVTDERGLPVPGAAIWLSEGMGPGEGEVVTRAGDDGRYQHDGVAGEERFVGAVAAGYAPSERRRIRPSTATVLELDFELRRGGGGTLAIALGAAEATVSIEPLFRGDRLGRRTVEVSGSATIDSLVPEWNILRVRAPRHAPQTLLARLSPAVAAETEVRLGDGAVLRGTVLGADGLPAVGARVDLVGWEWARLGVVTDATGAYRMERAPAARVDVRAAGADDTEAWTILRLEEGREHRWDPTLRPRAEIAGRVVDEGGAPAPRAAVTCWPAGTHRPDEFLELDRDGGFRARGLPNRAYRIAAWPGECFGPPAVEVAAVPGSASITIVLPRVQGFLRGVIATRDGAPAAGATARVWPRGSPDHEVRARAADDGSFCLGPLPAGSYFLEMHLDGEPTLHLDAIELGADETRELGVLRFHAGGRIRVRVVDASGAPFASGEEARVRSLDATVTFVVRAEGDAFVSEELAPGRYLVSGGMDGIVDEAEVTAGTTTDVQLRMRGQGILEAVALGADGGILWATFVITDARGRHVVTEGPESRLFERLASGPYTVTATDGSGARDARDVVVPSDGGTAYVAFAPR